MKPNVSNIKRSVDVPPINKIVKCGRMYRFIFLGVETIIPSITSARAMYYLIKNKDKGVSDEELCELIGYRPRTGSSETTNTERMCIPQKLTSTNLSGQVFEYITYQERKNAQVKFTYIRNKSIPELKLDIEALDQEIAVLRNKQAEITKKCRVELDNFFGREFISEFSASWQLDTTYPELCTSDREIFERVVEKALAKVRELEAKICELEKDRKDKLQILKQTQKTCNESFRWGYKSYPTGDGRWIVPRKSTKEGDYVRKLKGRFLDYLRDKCHPRPVALIEEIEGSIIRIRGINKYVSDEEWEILK